MSNITHNMLTIVHAIVEWVEHITLLLHHIVLPYIIIAPETVHTTGNTGIT